MFRLFALPYIFTNSNSILSFQVVQEKKKNENYENSEEC